MLIRIVWAVAIGLAVWLACLFLGGFLETLKADPVVFIGSFLKTYATIIGAIAGLLAFVTGWTPRPTV
jgi:hypothetical protein